MSWLRLVGWSLGRGRLSWSGGLISQVSGWMVPLSADCVGCWRGVMPYLTNNQRLDLGLVGACVVEEETLDGVVPAGYYVEGVVEKAEEPAAAVEVEAKKKK